MFSIVVGVFALGEFFNRIWEFSEKQVTQTFPDWSIAVLAGLEILLLLASSLLLVISVLLLGECLAAWRSPWRFSSHCDDSVTPRTVILVPAHDEATVITETLMSLQQQLREDALVAHVELLVIADNCNDDTAKLARQAGAKVLERNNTAFQGKGYALDYGLKHIAAQPPEIVVMIDADCQPHSGSIAALIQATRFHKQPVQGNYYMTLSATALLNGGLKNRITAFATQVKNDVRLSGLSSLGIPCLLVGSGMAFPWESLCSVNLASGELVEDMKLGFDLAIANHSPIFCREAVFTADLPQTESAALSQRTRWEHGRLGLTRHYWPKLMAAGLSQRRLGLIALALDMAILPLSLLVTLWLMLTCIAAAFTWVGSSVPLIVCVASGICITLAIISAWVQVGRQVLPLGQLLLVPFFILWKLPIFLKFVFNPQRSWIRTERDPV